MQREIGPGRSKVARVLGLAGGPLGTFFGPFSAPSRQTVKTLIFDDSCSENQGFCASRGSNITPKWLQNRSKIELRVAWGCLRPLGALLGALGALLGRSWWAFWALLGRSWRLLGPRMAPKRPPGGSREAPRRPKWSPRGLRMSPRRRQAFEKAPENSWEHRGATENARRARAAREQGPHAKTA